MPTIQRYVSSELTHFVGRKCKSDDERYALLLQILRDRWLAGPGFSRSAFVLTIDTTASICSGNMYTPQIVCFCDIPVPDFDIHVRKYSRFGLAFSKSFLIPHGAGPVFYVPKNSGAGANQTRCDYFDRSLLDYHAFFDRIDASLGVATLHEFRSLVTNLKRFLDHGLFSFVKFFDDELMEDDAENFYMEREWRLLGGVEFELDHVERVILPKEYSRAFRIDVPQYYGQLTFVE